jgi:cellulose synthase/poly-beta-1,6-N-acetylglucosamine synthase-like glycosyltransferase
MVLLYLWASLGTISLGIPMLYYLYMRRNSLKPWNLKIKQGYQPSISIVVPTYCEGEIIKYKLQNLAAIDYPQNLIQLIAVDSTSPDNTLDEVKRFTAENGDEKILLITEKERKGKAIALNHALKYATGEIVVVSDADCFWHPDTLKKTLPYLSDETVGAVAGQERLLNPHQSWVTETEAVYRDKMFKVQLGESKLYSTVQFEGGFSAYKRKMLDEFDWETGSDDSGTALNMIQKRVRTIVLPEAEFYTFFPHTWRGKITIKVRRAQHFVQIWVKCFKLLLKGKLVLPKRIFLPHAFLLLINPFIFWAFMFMGLFLLLEFPLLTLPLIALLLVPKTRVYIAELIQNNFVALLALMQTLIAKNSVIWKKADESRKNVNVETLKNHGLI